MSILKTTITFMLNNSPAMYSSMRNSVASPKSGTKARHMFAATCLALTNVQSRPLSSQEITKNILFISNENHKDLKNDPKTLKLNKPLNKPLCVMLNWMLAKRSHVHKYASIYLDQGYDVLSVNCSPWQLLWPMKGSQLVAADLLHFMEANKSFSPLILHGFSIGGYVFGELLFLAATDKKRYQPVLDRFIAQVWDSAADISEIPVGVPKAIFPKNETMQKALHKYILYHLKTFHEAATIHYMRSSQAFHLNLCHAPALFLLSKTDPVGAENSNRKVHDSWESLGIKCTWKCWDKSPHVQHFMKHPKEYVGALNDHLDGLGLISKPEKIKMRL